MFGNADSAENDGIKFSSGEGADGSSGALGGRFS